MSTRCCRSLCEIKLRPMKSELLPEPFGTVCSSAPWEAEGIFYEVIRE
jgi:hypothetical protein